MKPHQEEHKHKRFYLFSHLNGEDVRYRTSTGSWTDNFFEAMLWTSEDFVMKKAKKEKAAHAKWVSGYCVSALPDKVHPDADRKFVVGSVRVEVDGFYAMRVA